MSTSSGISWSQNDGRTPVILVGGPTASGKSTLALDMAEAFGGAVINADSMQIYTDLPILTASPSAEDAQRVPHRLYGVLDATEKCSAARWRDMALEEIRSSAEQGRLPILVGGTGLYFRTLAEGIAPVPPVPEEVVKLATERRALIGPEAFHAEVSQRDPVLGARLHVGDPQRLIRAWAVFEATGRPLSAWHADPLEGPPPDLDFFWIVLAPPREALYAGCDARFRLMVKAGALDEVERLLARNLDPALPAMKAVGVPELAAYLRGESNLETAISLAQQSTRHYAKRQRTWFRHQVVERWHSVEDHCLVGRQYGSDLKDDVTARLRRFLQSPAKA